MGRKQTKDLVGGLDGYLKQTNDEKENTPQAKANEVNLHFKIDAELKKRMEIYCIKEDINMKQFLNGLIRDFLDQHDKK